MPGAFSVEVLGQEVLGDEDVLDDLEIDHFNKACRGCYGQNEIARKDILLSVFALNRMDQML